MLARVQIPSLRERPEDVPPLTDHFTRHIGRELGHEIGMITPKVLILLQRHRYGEGNAREQKTALQQAIGKAMLENDPVLPASYLSERLREGSDTQPAAVLSAGPTSAHTHSVTTQQATAPELTALRRHGFVIRAAERELNLSHKSRTLSNHLRGICLQALCEQEWDVQRAADSVAASDDPRNLGKFKAKMRRYLETVADNGGGGESKLYNNLSAAYHPALASAISRVRGLQGRKSRN